MMLELRFSNVITVVVMVWLQLCVFHSLPLGAEAMTMNKIIEAHGIGSFEDDITSAGETFVTTMDAGKTTTMEDTAMSSESSTQDLELMTTMKGDSFTPGSSIHEDENTSTMEGASLGTVFLTKDVRNMTTMEEDTLTTESSTHDVGNMTTMEEDTLPTDSSTHEDENTSTMEGASLGTVFSTKDVRNMTTMEEDTLTTDSSTHEDEITSTMEGASLGTIFSTKDVGYMTTMEDVSVITESLTTEAVKITTINEDFVTFQTSPPLREDWTTQDVVLSSESLSPIDDITTNLVEMSETLPLNGEKTTFIDEVYHETSPHYLTKRSTMRESYTFSYLDDDESIFTRPPQDRTPREHSQDELEVLYKKHIATVTAFKCKEPRERAVYIRDLFDNVDSTHLTHHIHPNMVSLHRCGHWAGCCMAPIGHPVQCAMKTEQIVNVTFSVLEVDRNERTTRTIQVKNHTRCSCQDISKKLPIKLPVGELTPEL